MRFIAAAYSDIGNVKNINQDSMMVKIAESTAGTVACGIVCDGMGGLKSGEVASACVVQAFSNWFDHVLPQSIDEPESMTRIRENWNQMIADCNRRIMEYGRKNGFNIGTTLTGICIVRNQYITVNVGDSRVYMLKDQLIRLTKDQTVVEQEIDMGRMRPEDARTDPRRSVLLQCIGASDYVVPEYTFGSIYEDTGIVICSDGFRHEITNEEILNWLAPGVITESVQAEKNIRYLTDLVKNRGERDNITAVLLKTTRDEWSER